MIPILLNYQLNKNENEIQRFFEWLGNISVLSPKNIVKLFSEKKTKSSIRWLLNVLF